MIYGKNQESRKNLVSEVKIQTKQNSKSNVKVYNWWEETAF